MEALATQLIKENLSIPMIGLKNTDDVVAKIQTLFEA